MVSGSPGFAPQFSFKSSPLWRGNMWTWKCATDCWAPGPFAWTRFSPFGDSAWLTARATLLTEHETAASTSSLISKSVVVLLRYNEAMPVVSRIDVHESERVVVLQQFEAWHLPDNDFTEYAVVIPFHQILSSC